MALAKRSQPVDPVLIALENAALDDEPVTADECEAIERAKAEIRAGRVLSTAELRRNLGL